MYERTDRFPSNDSLQDVAAQRLEVRARAVATEAGTTMPDSLDPTLDNTQRPYIMEEDANQTCDVTEQWPSDRDFKAEMSAFPDGPIFVRGYRAHVSSLPALIQRLMCCTHSSGPSSDATALQVRAGGAL